VSRSRLYDFVREHHLKAPPPDTGSRAKGISNASCSTGSVPVRFFAIAIASFSPTLVGFAQARSYIEDAEQFLKNGDLKSAVIQLRNAVREAPDDSKIRAQLADAYLRTGDVAGAEREARAARDRKGDEADYLPVLAEVLLRQSLVAAW